MKTPQTTHATVASSATPDTRPVLRIVGYDHGGYVAWGWWKGWDGPGGVKESIARAMARLDRYPRLKWGFHVDGATWDWALDNDPQFVHEFLSLVDTRYRGRISLSSGGYGQPLSWTIGGEANVRQLVYDQEVYARLGRTIGIYMQNEHGFFPQMPQLLRGVGIDKAILRTVWGMYGICPEIDGSKVRWRSPDGSWVEAVPTYKGGNRGLGKNAWDTRIIIGLEGRIDFEPFRSHYLTRGIRFPVAVRIDDFGLPKEDDGSGGFDRLCSFSDAPGYRWVTGEEAFSEIPLEPLTLDARLDDFQIQMPWGYQGNLFWNLSRLAECELLTAERLAALNTRCGGAGWEPTLRSAWKSLLTAQHHDINICGVSSGGEYGEFLFDVAERLYGDATKAARTVTASVLKSMCLRAASGVGTADRPADRPADRTIVAFNPLGWDRTAIAEVKVKSNKGAKPAGFSLTRDGVPLEFQVVDTKDEPGGFLSTTTLAVGVPVKALGFTSADLSFLASPPPSDATNTVRKLSSSVEISTLWGAVAIGETGELLVRDGEGRQLLEPGQGNGRLSGYVEGKLCESSIARLEVLSAGPLYSVVRAAGDIGGLKCAMDIKTYRDTPRIDFQTSVVVHGERIGATRVEAEWEGKDEPMDQEKKLSVRFAPALGPHRRVLQDAPFSVDETTNRSICAGLWGNVSDGSRSVTLSNRGAMGYLWDGRTLRNILLYSGLYSWGERHAFLDGTYRAEYSLSFHTGENPARDAQRAGHEYNFPLAGLSATPRGGTLSLPGIGLEIVDADTGRSCPGLLVSALYTVGDQLFVRLHDWEGTRSTNVRILLCGTPVETVPVDLLHAETGPSGSSAEVPPFGIRTFRLKAGGRM